MQDYNMEMVRGDTLVLTAKITDLDQEVDDVYFTCRQRYESPIVFQKSLSDGIELVDTDTYQVRVAPEDTEEKPAGRYVYDLQISANGDVFTIARGFLRIYNDVTY